MAAVLCSKFPDKAGELFAYQVSIVRADRNYEGKRWAAYDRQYRRQALASQDLNCTMRPSRAALGRSPGAATVCKTTMRPSSAPVTHTDPCSGGSPTQRPGRTAPRAHTWAHRQRAAHLPARYAGATTKAGAATPGVVFGISAAIARRPTPPSAARRTQPSRSNGAAPPRRHRAAAQRRQRPGARSDDEQRAQIPSG